MARHLTEIQAKVRLNLGKSVAQFLSYKDEAEYTILKWITIDRGGDEKPYSVNYHEVFDEGSENDLNIHEFSEVDPAELPFGIIDEFDTADEALEFAAESYQASTQKYVTESMINEEYADYLRLRR